MLLAAMLLLVSGCGSRSSAWDQPLGPASDVGLDLTADSVGNLYLAVTDTTGSIQFASSSVPKTWSNWRELPGAPASGFDTATSPALSRAANRLFAFGRGADDNLYTATKTLPADWTSWQATTTDASVKGRIAVASTGVSEAHVAYTTGNGCRYLRLIDATIVSSVDWPDCIEATITTVGSDTVGMALRFENKLEFTQAERSSDWTFRNLRVIFTDSYEMSDLVFYNNAYHLVYAHPELLDDVQPFFVFELRHLWINATSQDVQFRVIDTYTPAGDVHAIPALAMYRDRLVTIWTTPSGYVNAARWDVADPELPWIVYRDIGWGAGKLRPRLTVANPSLSLNQYSSSHYGDDLHAAVLSKASPSVPTFIILSRAMMRPDITNSFAVYNVANSAGTPSRIWNLWSDNRPVITEIGFNLWMFPNWFVRKLYPNVVKWMCDDIRKWGPTSDPCTSRRLPVYAQDLGEHLFNSHGAWINVRSSAIDAWEETGHYAALALGMGNSFPPPDAGTAQRTGLSLSVLNAGRSLFTEGTASCPQLPPRCPGFTGYVDNYDATGREHSFLYTVYYYLNHPSELRSFINTDLASGNDLLKRKYEWVRVNIFRGVEF